MQRKLYWLECVDKGVPLLLTGLYFKDAGFEVRFDYWLAGHKEGIQKIIADVELWQPDIVSCGIYSNHFSEPEEWIAACQYIREHPRLVHTKIMVFLPPQDSTPDQDALRRQRYDFYTYGYTAFGSLEASKIAKKLIKE